MNTNRKGTSDGRKKIVVHIEREKDTGQGSWGAGDTVAEAVDNAHKEFQEAWGQSRGSRWAAARGEETLVEPTRFVSWKRIRDDLAAVVEDKGGVR